MTKHALTDPEGSDFGALYVVGAYLDASTAEAHHLLSALGLWPAGGEPLALNRRQWGLLAAMRGLRDALDVPWDELASAWVDLLPEHPFSREAVRFQPGVEGGPSPVGASEDLLATLAHWLHADPIELARLIDGHGHFLGLDRVSLALEATAPTIRAVRHLWWLKTRLGVTVDDFLALESRLHSAVPDADRLSHP